MASSTTIRKPLGIRATPAEHKLITKAAKREHRSVNSFVLRAAIAAAQSENTPSARMRTPEEMDAALRQAQELMRPYRREGHSMVDELLAERRAEAARE